MPPQPRVNTESEGLEPCEFLFLLGVQSSNIKTSLHSKRLEHGETMTPRAKKEIIRNNQEGVMFPF